MSSSSKIEWTDATWNPVRGCTKVSPGCKHCYAKTFAERFRGVPGHPYEQGFNLRLVPDKLDEPFLWTKPKLVFVNSMSDLFQNGVSDDFILRVVGVMEATPWHTYQILTKRSGRLKNLLTGKLKFASKLRHIWWGVSVENRKHGLPRIEHLREAKPAMSFLSIEPLLEDLGKLNLSRINWVIVGGESGHGARPMDKCWVEGIRRQCQLAKTPFFFKQWGGVNKNKTGRELNGQTYDEYPVIPSVDVPSRSERQKILEQLEDDWQ